MAKASVRDLRNHFPKVRELVETEGEVIVTDKGKPKYRLTLYTPEKPEAQRPKDYLARMRRHQPRPMPASAARALSEDNRGDR